MGTRHPIPPGARLKVLSVSANVTVIGEDGRQDLEIEPPDRHIEVIEDRILETKTKSTNLQIRVPAGLNVSVGAVSGHVQLTGRLGTIKVNSLSGNVEVERADGDVEIRSVSGSISIGGCGGDCHANTKSGRITLGHGDGEVKAHTISGSIDIGTAGKDGVSIKSISGRVTVLVDEGKQPRARLRSLSGRTRCDCPQGDDFDIMASTISGSIEIQGR